jgi:hypothetical protein
VHFDHLLALACLLSVKENEASFSPGPQMGAIRFVVRLAAVELGGPASTRQGMARQFFFFCGLPL